MLEDPWDKQRATSFAAPQLPTPGLAAREGPTAAWGPEQGEHQPLALVL